MLILGLTGSIGMGKSTTADMFRAEGTPVFDSDAEVHRLYAGQAVPLIEAEFPGTSNASGVDRARLAQAVLGRPAAVARLEAIVHPLVRHARAAFLDRARRAGSRTVVVDVPLLFETGADREVDAAVVVTAPLEVQRERVLRRPGMDEAKLAAILGRQMPDVEKRRRAHFVVDTGGGFDFARHQVAGILRAVAGMAAGRARSVPERSGSDA